jgi:hypothetical protein
MGHHKSEPSTYLFIIKERLDSSWSKWFDGLHIYQTEEGITILAGPLVDSVALYGVLAQIRDLDLTLLLMTRLEATLF